MVKQDIGVMHVFISYLFNLAPTAMGINSLSYQTKQWQIRSPSHQPGLYYRQVLHNSWDLQYSGDMQIGNQNVRAVLDTGSFELLVFSDRCTTPECSSSVAALYSNSRSSTYAPEVWYMSHAFGSGTCSSQMGYESVSFGPLTVQHQYFWEVIDASMPILEDGTFQAIVGLGPPDSPDYDAMFQFMGQKQVLSIEKQRGLPIPESDVLAYDDSREFLGLMKQEGTVLQNLRTNRFSVCLQPAYGAPGYLVWNDVNPIEYPQVFTKLTSPSRETWSFEMRSVHLWHAPAGQSFDLGCEDGCGALLDSGTSLIAVPTETFDRAWDALNRINADCDRIDELPDLVFELNGTRFSMPPHSYVGDVFGEIPERFRRFVPHWAQHACTLLFMKEDVDTQHGPLWILGMPFFREYYTTFQVSQNRSRENNAVYAAPVIDQNCTHPSEGHAHQASSLMKRHRKRIDASKIRISRSVRAALSQRTSVL